MSYNASLLVRHRSTCSDVCDHKTLDLKNIDSILEGVPENLHDLLSNIFEEYIKTHKNRQMPIEVF